MSNMRCDECRHWVEINEWEPDEAGLRRCDAIKERWRIAEKATEGREWPGGQAVKWDTDAAAVAWRKARNDAIVAAKACVQDGSDYHAELLTRPDFFCALFEARG